MSATEQAGKTGVMQIDEAEVMLRMVCALQGRERPEGTPVDALTSMQIPRQIGEGLERAAGAMIDYFIGVMNDGGIKTVEGQRRTGGQPYDA